MKTRALALGLLLLLSACSTGPRSVNPVRDLTVASDTWTFQGDHDFEAQHPGAGHSSRYKHHLGQADIFRYSEGRHDWAFYSQRFDMTVFKTVQDMVDIYRGKGIQATPEVLGALTGNIVTVNNRPLRGYRFDLVKAGGELATSYLYMTADQGGLLKYRLTFEGANTPDMQRSVVLLIQNSLPAQQPSPPEEPGTPARSASTAP